MKTWKIKITANSERDAQELTKLLNETFEISAKFHEPLHHLYANTKGPPMAKIECEEVRTTKGKRIGVTMMNILTYILLICFMTSAIFVGFKLHEVIMNSMEGLKTPMLVEYVLWGGYIFTIFTLQQVAYPLYKKYIYLYK